MLSLFPPFPSRQKYHSHLDIPPPGQTPPRDHKNQTARPHHHAAEDLQPPIAAVLAAHQRPADRIPHQGRDTDDREHGTRPHADLADIGDLGHEGGGEGDEGAAAEPVEGREEDVGDVAAGREPQA